MRNRSEAIKTPSDWNSTRNMVHQYEQRKQQNATNTALANALSDLKAQNKFI